MEDKRVLNKYIGDRDFYKRLRKIMIPVLIQNVITNFVSMLDNIMVGRVGTEQMSGVAISNQILFVFNLCIFGGLAGAGIFTAQYYGKKDSEGVRATFRAKIWAAGGIMLVGMIIVVFLGESIISTFIHEGKDNLDMAATLEYGKRYLSVMFFQMPLFAILNVYSSTLRETGDAKLPMRAGLAAVAVNLFFNYMLIYGKFGAPAMGVTGAAIATVISRVAECTIVIGKTHITREDHPYICGIYRTLRVPGNLTKDIIKKGVPLLLNELLWSSGMTLLNQILSLRGLEVVSAENISTTVSNLFFCAFFATGTSISIIIGQLLGAGELEKAVDEDRKLLAFSVALCTVVAVVMILMAPLFPKIYNTTDIVRNLATKMLTIAAIMMPFNAFSHGSYFTIRSGGKVLVTFIFDSGFVWAVSIPLTLAIVKLTEMPIVPVYFISYGADAIKCIIGYFLIKSKVWVNNMVSENELLAR